MRRRIQVNEDDPSNTGTIAGLLWAISNPVFTRDGKSKDEGAGEKRSLAAGFGGSNRKLIVPGQTFQPNEHYSKNKPNPAEVGSAI